MDLVGEIFKRCRHESSTRKGNFMCDACAGDVFSRTQSFQEDVLTAARGNPEELKKVLKQLDRISKSYSD